MWRLRRSKCQLTGHALHPDDPVGDPVEHELVDRLWALHMGVVRSLCQIEATGICQVSSNALHPSSPCHVLLTVNEQCRLLDRLEEVDIALPAG